MRQTTFKRGRLIVLQLALFCLQALITIGCVLTSIATVPMRLCGTVYPFLCYREYCQ